MSSYSALWGAIQTDYMAPAGAQLSTLATSGAVPVVSFAGTAQPYYSTIANVDGKNTGRLLPLGTTPNATADYFAPLPSTGALVANGNCRPLTAVASLTLPYFFSS